MVTGEKHRWHFDNYPPILNVETEIFLKLTHVECSVHEYCTNIARYTNIARGVQQKAVFYEASSSCLAVT